MSEKALKYESICALFLKNRIKSLAFFRTTQLHLQHFVFDVSEGQAQSRKGLGYEPEAFELPGRFASRADIVSGFSDHSLKTLKWDLLCEVHSKKYVSLGVRVRITQYPKKHAPFHRER